MPLETDIDAILSGNATLSALVGGRIYAGRAPQETEAPYLVWAIIDSGQVEDHDSGPDDAPLSDLLISVAAYAHSQSVAVDVWSAARAAIESSSLTLTIEVPRRDDRDDRVKLHVRSFDFTLWAQE